MSMTGDLIIDGTNYGKRDTIRLVSGEGVTYTVEGDDKDFTVTAQLAAGAPSANIEDAEEAHALNSTFDDTEVEAALDALGEKINAILALLLERGAMAEPEEEE